jgi:hypothetical protein
MFAITSRYYKIPTAAYTAPDGKTIAYVRRRILPPPENFQLLLEHTVVQGDRLDNITAQYLADPEQFWRIADANNAIQPADLTETVGSKLRITLPEGIPGARIA